MTAQQEAKNNYQYHSTYQYRRSSGKSVLLLTLKVMIAKGRIIGREGRNIEVLNSNRCWNIVDDTPEAIILSASIPRRKCTFVVTQTVTDGRIHPARIEEVVQKPPNKLKKKLLKLGRELLRPWNPRFVSRAYKSGGANEILFSYGQNLYITTEVARLCGVMAAELGLNANWQKSWIASTYKVPETEPKCLTPFRNANEKHGET